VVGEGTYGVDKFINEVTVVVTPPQENDITEFVGIFIKEVGTDSVFDRFADCTIAVVIPANFLDRVTSFDAECFCVILDAVFGCARNVHHCFNPPEYLATWFCSTFAPPHCSIVEKIVSH
jgi:hypothetical protein